MDLLKRGAKNPQGDGLSRFHAKEDDPMVRDAVMGCIAASPHVSWSGVVVEKHRVTEMNRPRPRLLSIFSAIAVRLRLRSYDKPDRVVITNDWVDDEVARRSV